MKPKPRMSSISSHCTRKQTFRMLILYLSVCPSVRPQVTGPEIKPSLHPSSPNVSFSLLRFGCLLLQISQNYQKKTDKR